jgi:coenzyme PQQ precursor peptide PqqA
VGESTHPKFSYTNPEHTMTWTKPEAEIVAVTMEVTAYVATL